MTYFIFLLLGRFQGAESKAAIPSLEDLGVVFPNLPPGK